MVVRVPTVRRVYLKSAQPMAVQTLCLGSLFAVGMVGGYLYSGACIDNSNLALSEYLAGYCQLFNGADVAAISLGSALRLYFGYCAAAFLLGFTSVGALAVPVVAGIYGFSLMFAVACFVRIYGPIGIVLALAALGIRAVFTLPCFFWIASTSWSSAFSMAAASKGKRCAPAQRDSGYWYRLAVCVVLLFVGVVCELRLTPSLFHFALRGIA